MAPLWITECYTIRTTKTSIIVNYEHNELWFGLFCRIAMLGAMTEPWLMAKFKNQLLTQRNNAAVVAARGTLANSFLIYEAHNQQTTINQIGTGGRRAVSLWDGGFIAKPSCTNRSCTSNISRLPVIYLCARY